MSTPSTVATDYFDALGRGDVPAAMALLSPDIIWYQPGANRFSGTHQGINAVASLLGGMMEASPGTFELAVAGEPMVNGGLVAVPVRFSGSRPDATMDMPGLDLLTVHEGAITEVHLFSSKPSAEDNFWGQANN